MEAIVESLLLFGEAASARLRGEQSLAKLPTITHLAPSKSYLNCIRFITEVFNQISDASDKRQDPQDNIYSGEVTDK
jgi:hypothetical protein